MSRHIWRRRIAIADAAKAPEVSPDKGLRRHPRDVSEGMARHDFRFWFVIWSAMGVALVLAALFVWQDDILEAFLDPQVPYTVYRPPAPPDYARTSAWDQLPRPGERRNVDVFFVHPTTFNGGKDWNGPIDDPDSQALYGRIVAPNYAAPFAAAGAIFAPRYRQASLYTSLTLFDDAVEAREFAYGDVKAAFDYYIDHLSGGRPFILVGVEQGGALAARLLADEIAARPDLRRRLVAAYLIETTVRADGDSLGAPACVQRNEAGCVVAWVSSEPADFRRILSILTRSQVWDPDGRLVALGRAPILCVNPLLGGRTDVDAPERFNLGAANATGLEWGARPGFMARQVSARCEAGILRVSRPRSASLQPQGGMIERLRAPPYNLFWADLEADALARKAAFLAANPRG
jgi:hypothetical protein